MPKTSHQHFSVALLSKVNDKNWPETKIWKASCVTFFQYLRKKTNQILITIYEADVHTQIQIAANPPDFIFKSQPPSPLNPDFWIFSFLSWQNLFFNALNVYFFVEKSRKKYIEISTKNKQLLTTTPQSKHYTIEPKSLQSPNWFLFNSYNLTRNFLWYSYWNLMKWQV